MKLKMTKWSEGSFWLPDLLPTSMEKYGLSPVENLVLIFICFDQTIYFKASVGKGENIVFPEIIFSYFLSF